MTTDNKTWELRSKNTPVITAYCHRCREREQNENLRDYNFNFPKTIKEQDRAANVSLIS